LEYLQRIPIPFKIEDWKILSVFCAWAILLALSFVVFIFEIMISFTMFSIIELILYQMLQIADRFQVTSRRPEFVISKTLPRSTEPVKTRTSRWDGITISTEHI